MWLVAGKEKTNTRREMMLEKPKINTEKQERETCLNKTELTVCGRIILLKK